MSAEALSQAEHLKRRTDRILLRIPIEVKGTDANGTAFREKTHTLAVNRHGARIALNASLVSGSRVTITNLQNSMSCPFRVVSCLEKSLSGTPEWGVECLDPGANFWGIFFPEKAARTAKEELIDVVLECVTCRSRELAQLTLEQYQAVVTGPSLSRSCANCLKTTSWTFAIVQGNGGEGERMAALDAPSFGARPVERRRSNRVSINLPVRIRLEEIGRTENLSTEGVCFSSRFVMRVGDRVRLTVGYTPGGNEKEVSARVVWLKQVEGEERFLYGVQIEDSS